MEVSEAWQNDCRHFCRGNQMEIALAANLRSSEVFRATSEAQSFSCMALKIREICPNFFFCHLSSILRYTGIFAMHQTLQVNRQNRLIGIWPSRERCAGFPVFPAEFNPLAAEIDQDRHVQFLSHLRQMVYSLTWGYLYLTGPALTSSGALGCIAQ
jgi:hypothetical protein